MKKLFELLTHRIVVFSVSTVVQLVILTVFISRFSEFSTLFYISMLVFSSSLVLWIISSKANPAYKLAWIMPIIVVPIFGAIFYAIFGNNGLSKRERKNLKVIKKLSQENIDLRPTTYQALHQEDPVGFSQSTYIQNYAYTPAYTNTTSDYFSLGEHMYARLLDDLKQAQHFIFLEFFIIAEGTMWQGILEILEEKVKQGLDVRVCYDDVGCIVTLPKNYHKTLQVKGIKASVFNPIKLKMSSKYNHRNHRKIAVIDGHIAYTGGCNIGDEYINAIVKHGHWKDAAIRLQGDAAWSMTVMFLSMWDYINQCTSDYKNFKTIADQVNKNHQKTLNDPDRTERKDLTNLSEGLVQPFSDNPLDYEPVGNHIYLNLIAKAQRYVYIKTPYLIIDHGLTTALSLAAKSGVEVIIITPGMADKWYVHETTRSYYQILLEEGVQVLEYTPGFMHEKTIVVDDHYAVIGTVNLDYRSLYLHFECGVWLWRNPAIQDMKNDFLDIMKLSKAMTLDQVKQISLLKKALRAFLRVFSPLM